MPKPLDKIGPYTLINKLGRGAFGVVWLAEKRTAITTTRVAIKIPNDMDIDLEAVKQEAALWVQASGHPNILPIIDADIYDEQVIIVSEYAPDGSLSKWLARHGGQAPSIESAGEMMLGVLAGLEFLHKRGIIHRDLKPDNILLQNDIPRLADFGIARVLKTTSESTIATGTPAYMPPEAFDGKRSVQTDIWSAGVIFYQLLEGRLPFAQAEFTALVGAILTKEPEPLSVALPTSLERIIKRALEKEPEKRYSSAAEMRLALRQALMPPAAGGREQAGTQALPRKATELQSTITNPMLPQKPQEIVSTITAQVPTIGPVKDSAARPVRRGNQLFWVVGGLGALVLIGLLTAGVSYYMFLSGTGSSGSLTNNNVSPAPAPSTGPSTATSSPSTRPSQSSPSPGGNLTGELRAKIDGNKSLDDYSAYKSGDGYYVLIPKTSMSDLTVTTDKGISQPSWEQRGGSVLLKFELATGMTARIEHTYNRLEITFSPPR